MDRVARRGPLARAPGALKSHNAEKTERGDTLGFFNIHSVAKHQKNAGGPFEEKNSRKSLTMPKKTERGDTLGFFNIHSVAKHQKNAGGPFEEKKFPEKSRSAEKNWKGGPFGIFQHPFCRKTAKN